ncbi:MAG: HD domain-containing phosphohydrolase [Aliiglaciecola sp.]|uniref:HD domain-containing phosphohydrolase n=1 Tax=Aliiglaciecola sp. TaxID=1872441 RepID=UPI0032974E8C
MSEQLLDDEISMTVLCVDDEVNILKSLKRLLYKQNYQLLLAESGAKALEIMAQNKIDLILSDMKMPGMSGAELLQKVAESEPDCHRILLTGYSDMESTIDAVNKGKIHRYLQKPWNNEEIIKTIDEGLEKVRLKNENNNLQKLVKKQNSLLKKLNQNLEDKVKLRTKQIHLAMQRIEHNNNATQKVLYNMISINPNISGGFANSVSLLAKRIAEKLALPPEQVSDISYAALLCEIGLLGLDSAIYSRPFKELNYNQQQEFLEQINIAKLVLAPANHLQNVSDIITCQFEALNGTGPKKLEDEQIPIGAKVLAVARDYWRYKTGRITGQKLDDIACPMEMKKQRGTHYDPAVLDILLDNDDIASDKFIENIISTQDLKPGMILRYNILNDKHILVLPEGHEFSDSTILKLTQFEKSQSQPLSLVVEDCREEI